MSRYLYRLLVIFLVSAQSATATFQKPDKLSHNGLLIDFDSFSFPMETYFERHPEKKEAMTAGQNFQSYSTNLWRGHVATYQIVDDKLVLKELEVAGPPKEIDGNDDTWVSVIDRAFPDGKTVHISWFSDFLILPIGKEVYSRESSKSYGKYFVMNIKKGILLSKYVMYGSPRDIRQAYAQGKLNEYSNRVLGSCQVHDADLVGLYIGDCEAGFAHGRGIALGRDEYRGEFIEGEVHGRGIYTWGPKSDWQSERHDGYFGNGEKDGFGETSVESSSTHIDLDWYEKNALEEGDKFVLRGMFVDHEFVLACDSPSDCQHLIEENER